LYGPGGGGLSRGGDIFKFFLEILKYQHQSALTVCEPSAFAEYEHPVISKVPAKSHQQALFMIRGEIERCGEAKPELLWGECD
jgi:hypothetical protein